MCISIKYEAGPESRQYVSRMDEAGTSVVVVGEVKNGGGLLESGGGVVEEGGGDVVKETAGGVVEEAGGGGVEEAGGGFGGGWSFWCRDGGGRALWW